MRNGGNRNIRKMNTSDGGFTLVEIVLSIAILAIVSLPLLQYFSESMRYSSMMEERQQAAFLAQEVTEGLLAESELVSRDTESDEEDAYKIPYFDAEEWSDVVTVAEGSELTVTAARDGYQVEVTVDDPSDFDKIQGIPDYRIDLPANVIYIDTTENTRAVFEFMGMYNTFYDRQDQEAMPSITEDMIRKNMSREMRIGLSRAGGKYRVTLRYIYSCPVVYDKDGNPAVWTSEVLMDETTEVLKNIYLVYEWNNNGDTITFDTTGIDEADRIEMSLGLYIICQQKDGDELPGSGYKVTVDRTGDPAGEYNGFPGKIFGYTNLSAGQVVYEDGTFLEPEPYDPEASENLQPAVIYTIHTKVYLEGDLLADITTMKGE